MMGVDAEAICRRMAELNELVCHAMERGIALPTKTTADGAVSIDYDRLRELVVQQSLQEALQEWTFEAQVRSKVREHKWR